jgi:hypothetical protein
MVIVVPSGRERSADDHPKEVHICGVAGPPLAQEKKVPGLGLANVRRLPWKFSPSDMRVASPRTASRNAPGKYRGRAAKTVDQDDAA